MVAVLGSFGLYVALFGALLSAGLWGCAAWRMRDGSATPTGVIDTARQATLLGFAGTVAAVGAMEWALITNDFSLAYVAENSSQSTPLLYRITALWSALDGSLLLWLLVLAGYGVLLSRRPPPWTRLEVSSRMLASVASCVVALVAVSFAILVVVATTPFARLDPAVTDGAGPNPLLADHPAMAIHPPLLYLGYIGLVVPFGYAVAALVVGDAGTAWVQRTRRWTLLAWICLTAGIVLGAWWSYAVLGWGGYWAWDPVENASLLPWLTATALLHSALRTRSSPAAPVWNVALAGASFLLVVAGTFLTRSGVVLSVHSFTTSPLGPALLSVLVVWLSIVVALLIWRSDRLLDPGTDTARRGGLSGRATALLLNNVLLVGLAVALLVGTLLPVVAGAFGRPVSVGAPYFNRLAVPISLALLGLISWASVTRWRAEPRAIVWRRAWFPVGVGAVSVAALGLGGARGVAPVLALALAAAVVTAAGQEILRSFQLIRPARWWQGRRLIGGHLAHAGLAIAAAGIAASSAWSVNTEQTVPLGGSLQAGRVRAQLVSIETTAAAGAMRTTVDARLSARGEAPHSEAPALVYYPGRDQTVTVPAIGGDWRGDAYLTVLAVAADGSTVTVRLADEPGVGWLWAGAGLIVIGGALAARTPSRRRQRPRAVDSPTSVVVALPSTSVPESDREPVVRTEPSEAPS